MGYDRKYGKITTEFGDIAEDEPVIVFRGRDLILPKLLSYYMLFCMKEGSPKRHLDIIYNSMINIQKWQDKNSRLVKVPDSESSKERLES